MSERRVAHEFLIAGRITGIEQNDVARAGNRRDRPTRRAQPAKPDLDAVKLLFRKNAHGDQVVSGVRNRPVIMTERARPLVASIEDMLRHRLRRRRRCRDIRADRDAEDYARKQTHHLSHIKQGDAPVQRLRRGGASLRLNEIDHRMGATEVKLRQFCCDRHRIHPCPPLA